MIIATGRMYRSVLPYVREAGIEEPVVCYQGAAVVRPTSDEWLYHAPLELELARQAIAALEEDGYFPNVYVDDGLYVAQHTPYSRAYAEFQRLPVTEVGNLLDWLDRAPTKLVAVGDPSALPDERDRLRARFDGALFITTSLPSLLEIGHRDISKGTGLRLVADELDLDPSQFVAFGDGENDLELLAEAGFGISVENGNPLLVARADATCAGPDGDGVAIVIESYLDSLA